MGSPVCKTKVQLPSRFVPPWTPRPSASTDLDCNVGVRREAFIHPLKVAARSAATHMRRFLDCPPQTSAGCRGGQSLTSVGWVLLSIARHELHQPQIIAQLTLPAVPAPESCCCSSLRRLQGSFRGASLAVEPTAVITIAPHWPQQVSVPLH
jgi:hypothetical protein